MNKLFFYWLVIILHSVFNIFLWFGWIFNNKLILEIHFSTLLISIYLFYLCNGCIITKLERLLSKSKWTIIDPILNKLKLSLSRNNRTKITLFLFGLSLLITLYKLYV
jgi:hypothetical protein